MQVHRVRVWDKECERRRFDGQSEHASNIIVTPTYSWQSQLNETDIQFYRIRFCREAGCGACLEF